MPVSTKSRRFCGPRSDFGNSCRHSAELAKTELRLKQEIARRRAMERLLRENQRNYEQLLAQRQHLSRQILSAQEEERMRISRELHDVVAQTLTGIDTQLARLDAEATVDIKNLAKNISRTRQLVVNSVNIVHRFARELRPAALDDLGLFPALRAFIKSFTEQTGLRVSLTADGPVKHLNSTERTVLYRVAQEALANVARHAQAKRVAVKIQKLRGQVHLQIRDDGQGFAAEHKRVRRKNTRLGLLGMRERLEMVSGKLTIRSTPGKGTTVLAQIPFTPGGR